MSELTDTPLTRRVADDSVLLREGLARLLEESGFEVAGQAGDAEDLLRKVGAHKPDVAVVDVRMPPTHTDEGLRAAHQIRAEHPGTGVLVLSQYVEEAYALDLLSESTESTGYLLKDRVADVDTFTDAVRRVAGGGSRARPRGRRAAARPPPPRGPARGASPPREREVLGLMAEGRSNAAIAEALVVTERAVEKHVTSIFSQARPHADGRGPPPRARRARLPARRLNVAPARGTAAAPRSRSAAPRAPSRLTATHARAMTATPPHDRLRRPTCAAPTARARPPCTRCAA